MTIEVDKEIVYTKTEVDRLIALALFLDGLLRILGIIPPFMDLDVGIIDEIVERVEKDLFPYIQKYVPGV